MISDITHKLLKLNHQFYQTFATQFSATRTRVQPGVHRTLKTISSDKSILDLGCGNGELSRELFRHNHKGMYVGLDFDAELISIAGEKNFDIESASFIHSDLSSPDWDAKLPKTRFEVILAFAVLHHIPGIELRQRILQKIRALLNHDGRLILSNWQFLNSQRIRNRIQPWSAIGLIEEDVDNDDYLIDWRRGGYGLRYVHHFSKDELNDLATNTGFRVVDTFISDGEGGNLGLYQVWELEQ